jgi:hypothetical protein
VIRYSQESSSRKAFVLGTGGPSSWCGYWPPLNGHAERLTSIPGQIIELRFRAAWWLRRREPELQGTAAHQGMGVCRSAKPGPHYDFATCPSENK